MCALAALLLYWKIQNIKERKQRQAEEKAQQAKSAAEKKKADCACKDTADKQ